MTGGTTGGRIGIGTTTPGTMLAIGSSTNFINLSPYATSTFAFPVRSNCFTTDGNTCISGGSNYFTNSGEFTYLSTGTRLAVGTSTPQWNLQVASTTGPQLALSDGTATSNHWTMRSMSGSFFVATASPSTFATSSVAAFVIDTNAIITTIKQVVRDYIELATDGVRLSAADGVLTMLGIGNGNDENLTWDFDNGTANSVVVGTGTGVNLISFAAALIDLAVPDEVYGAGWNGSNNVPTKNAVYDQIETIAASVLTEWPTAVGPTTFGASNRAYTGNTTGFTGLLHFPEKITINKITVWVGTVTVSGTMKFCLYTEDGQTKLLDQTTGTISTGTATSTQTISPAVTVNPGNYYWVLVPISTTNLEIHSYTSSNTIGNGMGNTVTSEPVLYGTQTVTAGTCPTSFNPTSGITAGGSANTQVPILRLDN